MSGGTINESFCSGAWVPGWVSADVTVAVGLALPHLLYAFIWHFPHVWRNTFKQHSVDVFVNVSVLGKVLQFLAAAAWLSARLPYGLCLDTTRLGFPYFLTGLVLFALGQTLNFAAIQAIGKPGIYYGFKLGYTVPWVSTFPFDAFAHPQYVGSVLSVWGAALLLWQQPLAPPSSVAALAAYWTGLYVLTGLWEHWS